MASAIPHDLKSYGRVRLEKLDSDALSTLCQDRGLLTADGPDAVATMVDRLFEWKSSMNGDLKNCVGHKMAKSHPTETARVLGVQSAGLGLEQNGHSTCCSTSVTSATAMTPGVNEAEVGTLAEAEAAAIPHDLKSYGRVRLEKLDSDALSTLCQDRDLLTADGPDAVATMVGRLFEWKLLLNHSSDESGISEVCAQRHDLMAISATPGIKMRCDPSSFSQPVTIISHNIQKFTLNCTCFGVNILQERIYLLVKCYKKSSCGLPDILAIQECQAGSEPLQELADEMNRAASKSCRRYDFCKTGKIGTPTEAMSWIYDTARFDFIACAIGIPISPKSGLLKRNLVQGLDPAFARDCGFDDDELKFHTYRGVSEIADIFIRQPGYALFRDKATDRKLLVCSVHLHSDPTAELAYTGELLHSDPEKLLLEKNIISILCGDLNLTACKSIERQELPVHGRNERKWDFGLKPPFSNHTTNLGSAFSAEKSESPNQCYDNFIIPSYLCSQRRTHVGVISLPPGFIDFLNLKKKEHFRSEGEQRSTRSRKDLVSYVASNYFSDHLPIQLQFCM